MVAFKLTHAVHYSPRNAVEGGAPVAWWWKLTDEQRGGLTSRQFTRSGYQLMRLKLGDHLTHVVRRGAKHLIAPADEVRALQPELAAAA
jgi:hypothetical protein